ncbi:MAG: glycosyltransferase family 39 protein [Bacteroidetes bacterium]|nr:glycosyltransferase family 39 protein [Bacteroidota bacterium]
MWKKLKSEVHGSDVLLLLLWLLALLLVSPFGEYPVNDDWSYAKNVYNLTQQNKFVVDTWPAMNLVSQTLYASGVVSVFGFSFVTLRMSVLVLVVIASLTLKRTIEDVSGCNKWFALFAVVVFFFNPMMLELSFTYMTDMFFVSMVIFAIRFLVLYLQHPKLVWYVLFAFFCVVAVLNRQHGLFVSLLSASLFTINMKWWKKLFLIFLPPVLVWLAHDKYRHFLTANHVPHGIKYSGDLLNYLSTAPTRNHFIHAGDSLIVLGLLMLPLLLVLIFSGVRPKLRHILYSVPVLLLMGYFISWGWDIYPCGNINLVLECGPQVVKTGEMHRAGGWLETVRLIQLVLGTISVFLAGVYVLFRKSACASAGRFLPLALLAVALTFYFFVAVSDAYFDRYSIPLALMLLLLLIPQEQFVFTRKSVIVALLSGVFLFSISVIEVRDYFEWQNTRWRALTALHAQGVTAAEIDGGFEYNGWYKPIEGWPEGEKSWWWVKDDVYIVSSQRFPNYEVKKTYAVQRILPVKHDTIFVLRRK